MTVSKVHPMIESSFLLRRCLTLEAGVELVRLGYFLPLLQGWLTTWQWQLGRITLDRNRTYLYFTEEFQARQSNFFL
jgi:hypothetical protein